MWIRRRIVNSRLTKLYQYIAKKRCQIDEATSIYLCLRHICHHQYDIKLIPHKRRVSFEPSNSILVYHYSFISSENRGVHTWRYRHLPCPMGKQMNCQLALYSNVCSYREIGEPELTNERSAATHYQTHEEQTKHKIGRIWRSSFHKMLPTRAFSLRRPEMSSRDCLKSGMSASISDILSDVGDRHSTPWEAVLSFYTSISGLLREGATYLTAAVSDVLRWHGYQE